MPPSAGARTTIWSIWSRRAPRPAWAEASARSSGRHALVAQGAHKVIVGTAAFHTGRHQRRFSADGLAGAIGRERLIVALDSKGGRIVVKGWRESTELRAEEVLRTTRALLLRGFVHLCRQRRHDAGHRPRLVSPPARRHHPRDHRRRRHHHPRRSSSAAQP